MQGEGVASSKKTKEPSSSSNGQSSEERRRERRERRAREKERKARELEAQAAAATAGEANGNPEYADVDSGMEPVVGEELEALNTKVGEAEEQPEEPKYFPFVDFVSNPQLLANILSFMTFYDWCILSSVSREIRIMLVQSALLREEVLERFLKTVGYSRWAWQGREPLSLSLQVLFSWLLYYERRS